LYNNIIPPSHLPPKANYYLFKVGGMALRIECKKLTVLIVGRNYSRMGGRGEQAWGKMEYPIAQRQKQKQRRQNVAVYGMYVLHSLE